MNKLKLQDIEKISLETNQEFAKYKKMLMVCTGTACVSSHGFDILNKFTEVIKEKGLDKEYLAIGTGCNGFCAVGPICVVQPEGIFYQKLKVEDIEEIVEKHLIGNEPVEKFMHKDPVSGAINPKMKDIILDANNPDQVIKDVIASGIRGRGGGGFPTGIKWESAKNYAVANSEEIYIVCNADEGDPGAYMDRSIIETDPHSVIEGMIIGAFATGSKEGYIYIRKEYPLALERLKIALSQAKDIGY